MSVARAVARLRELRAARRRGRPMFVEAFAIMQRLDDLIEALWRSRFGP